MRPWETIASTPFVQQLGWTLLHSLWQAAAVALLLAVVLGVIPARRSDVRYGACCLALLAVCVWFVLTLFVVQPAGVGRLDVAAGFTGGPEQPTAAADAELAARDSARRRSAHDVRELAVGGSGETAPEGRRADQATRWAIVPAQAAARQSGTSIRHSPSVVS